MWGFGTYAELGYSDSGAESFQPTDYEAFIKSSKASRFLLEFSAIKRQGGYLGESTDFTYADGTYADVPGGSATLDEKTYFFADGTWIGRPDDDYQTNRLAEPALVATGDIERTLPMSPESSRRGEITVGTLQFTNVDGRLDELIATRSIANRQVTLYYGPRLGKFSAFSIISEMLGQDFENDFNTVSMRVSSTATYLSEPFHTTRYQGTGGQQGDLSLADTFVPVCYGDCRNITPVLERADIYMYRVHDGPILAVDFVYDGMLPFDYVGDFPTYNALVAHVFADTGQYATCLKAGRFRASFAGGPQWQVTADVRGDKDAAGYTDRMGEILLKIATQRAKIGTNALDVVSFSGLPTGSMGYYNAQDDISCAAVFDNLLRSINGWYGTRRNKLLRVAYVLPPERRATSIIFDTNDAINLVEIEVEQPPRYEQAVIWRKNWTKLNADQISSIVDTDVSGFAQSDGYVLRESSAETKVRDRNAIVGDTIQTYFVNQADAQEVLSRIMDLYRETRRRFNLTLSRIGYLYDLQTYVILKNKRYGLQDGLNCVVIGTRDDNKKENIVLTLWG